jgi:hypothetical protein
VALVVAVVLVEIIMGGVEEVVVGDVVVGRASETDVVIGIPVVVLIGAVLVESEGVVVFLPAFVVCFLVLDVVICLVVAFAFLDLVVVGTNVGDPVVAFAFLGLGSGRCNDRLRRGYRGSGVEPISEVVRAIVLQGT